MPRYEAFPTMITPYDKQGRVDLETVKKYVHWYHDRGCPGIFAVCQSSEIFYLSEEELVAIHRTVWETVQEIAQKGGRRMTVVSSGHVANDIEAQAQTLCRIAKVGTDALILITNRLDLHGEGDDVWIANAERLLAKLPSNVKLGLYECPYPYKRLLTPRILRWCMETGRFAFIKDTCCDVATMKERCELLQGSGIRLFNANCQTLSVSMKNGAAGYCGIMCNFHPALYVWLCENFEKDPERVEKLQRFLTLSGFTENGLPYPLTAKYHMGLVGIPTENYARNLAPARLTDYAKYCILQMKAESDEWERLLRES